MTVAKYPYPKNAGWSRGEVIDYLVGKGAKKAEAMRWSKDRIENLGVETWWNGAGWAYTTFFDETVVRKITRRTVAKWRRDEERARICRRNRDTVKRLHIARGLGAVRTASVIVIDTETTGLWSGRDEVLELAIVDAADGSTLFHSRFRPVRHRAWDEAASVNGIYPEDVADETPISAYRPVIQKILDAATTVIGYNVNFDIGMLQGEGFELPFEKGLDVMEPFAEIYGEWSRYFGNYKWQTLETCAQYYGYQWNSKTDAHSSLADARATLYCWKKMQAAS